ncbi:MAG: hypothetical protein IPP51_14150 [Bacteroidetes bacterium]|nr:hypothetical protein [Bacteroidota bacterium]
MKLTSTIRTLNSIVLFSLMCITSSVYAQVSLPERNPCKLSFRAGAMSNNGDNAANLRLRTSGDVMYTINLDYAAVGEAELVTDLLHFRGAGMSLQTAALYARPEFKVSGSLPTNAGDHRVGLTQLEMVRAALVFTFNGTDPYVMFELPYHSNHEAVLGICGMIARTEKTTMTSYATDSLGITSIKGDFCQALGVTFGWNWRIGDSGWVFGLNGEVMFVVNKSHLVTFETDENSIYG